MAAMFLTCVAGLAVASAAAVQSYGNLPIVDLGYELHQASYLNSTGGFYNFSNIRYAQPPVGELRFAAPIPPTGRSKTVDNGNIGRICPQANPAWELIAEQFIPDYLTHKPFNLSAAEAAIAASSSSAPPQDPRTTEDCLFLDVVVPQQIFNRASKTEGPGGASVLVWIYGGGYVNGEKSAYSPAGLLKASQVSDPDGIIFVSLNYRLGAFGWLAGPTFQGSGGVSNAGLYDQRLALQWIQHHIHLFGGDAKKVTVIGESAGGGSIMHQITAYGGLKGPAPFDQAVLQSPGFQLIPGNAVQEDIYNTFLALLKVGSLEELRQAPSDALIKANLLQVANSSYGLFTYGPVVDGTFAPALPGKLLLQGSFDHSLQVMVGHNADEGLLFTNPAIMTTLAFGAYITSTFPDISPKAAAYVENVLYPPVFDGSHGYIDETSRVATAIAESVFTCNTYYLDRAYGNNTYGYEFAVPPALHGDDVPYTFANGPSPAVKNEQTAIALQEYITSFVEKSVPSAPGVLKFPLYGDDAEIVDLNVTSITEIMDPTANARCLWWQKALVF